MDWSRHAAPSRINKVSTQEQGKLLVTVSQEDIFYSVAWIDRVHALKIFV